MAEANPKNRILALWDFLSAYGNENFENATERKFNTITNQVSAFFIFQMMTVVAGIVVFALLSPLVQKKLFRYAMAYGGASVLPLLGLVLSFFLRKKVDHLFFMGLAQFIGVAHILLFSVFLGAESQYHLYLYALVPLPFFSLSKKDPLLIILGVALSVIAIVFISLWHQNNAPLFPIEEHLTRAVSYVIMFWLLVAIVGTGYYSWIAEKYERRLIDEKDKVQEMTEILNDVNGQLILKNQEIQFQLDLAAEIQANILPRLEKGGRMIQFERTYKPMDSVSGDYYDVFDVGKELFVLISDISGHGIPAALITMAAKQMFANAVLEGLRPAKIFEQVNRKLFERVRTQDFATAFLIHFDNEGEAHFCNGGHCNPVYYSARDDSFSLLQSNGFPLGVASKHKERYEDQHLRLTEGDRLFLYTDGLIELRDERNNLFGIERLLDFLEERRNLPLKKIHKQLDQTLEQFRGVAEYNDDLTMLSLQVGSS